MDSELEAALGELKRLENLLAIARSIPREPRSHDCTPCPELCPPGVHSMFDFCPGRAVCEGTDDD